MEYFDAEKVCSHLSQSKPTMSGDFPDTEGATSVVVYHKMKKKAKR